MAVSPVRTSRVKTVFSATNDNESIPFISTSEPPINTGVKDDEEDYPVIDAAELEARKRRSRRLRQERLKQNMIFRTGAFLLMIGVAFICKWLQDFVKAWKQSAK
eukprot:GEMP01021926.1.p1 GENE.GEMP01021926.1~~GEMP01021926.1.p1  ORF type:complete len:105 (+),score=23.58 GEMP01021926.1:128-442(+)